MLKKVLLSAGVVLTLACGVGFMGAQTVQAAGRFEAGSAGYIKSDETVDGSAYLAGNSERVEGVVNGDVYCAGKDLIINGTVNGDVICAGMTITINGKVTGNVRVAGNSVTIAAEIGGNLTAFGGTVTVESSAKIAKDAVLAGGSVLVNGSVGRDLVGGGSQVTINGPVGRDVEGQYETLAIGKDAVIGGFVHYGSTKDAVISGKVAGSVQRKEPQDYSGQQAAFVKTPSLLVSALVGIAWVVVMALSLMLVLPKKMATITNLSGKGAAFAALIGFGSLFGIPLLAVVALMTIIAAPLGIAMMFAWCALLVASVGVSAIYVGRLIGRRTNMHPVIATILGGVLLALLMYIPLLGFLVTLVVVSFGLGAMLYAVRGEYEGGKKAKVKLAKG